MAQQFLGLLVFPTMQDPYLKDLASMGRRRPTHCPHLPWTTRASATALMLAKALRSTWLPMSALRAVVDAVVCDAAVVACAGAAIMQHTATLYLAEAAAQTENNWPDISGSRPWLVQSAQLLTPKPTQDSYTRLPPRQFRRHLP